MYNYYDAAPEPRIHRVSTNLSDRECQVVHMRKDELGIRKISEFLRLMALGESQYPILDVPRVNNELRRQLLSTTSNLNQLVRHMNSHGACDDLIREAWKERVNISELLNKTLGTLMGQMDARIVWRLATEMLDKQSLTEAIAERNSRGLD